MRQHGQLGVAVGTRQWESVGVVRLLLLGENLCDTSNVGDNGEEESENNSRL